MNAALLKRVEELFFAKLEAKTGWGRNEIKQLYIDAQREALLEQLG